MLKKEWLVILLLVFCGCAGRKVRVQVQNNPVYMHKGMPGPNYAVRVKAAGETVQSEVLDEILKEELRIRMPLGFTYVDDITKANFVFFLATDAQTSSHHVPAQAYYGFNNYGGSGAYVGAHETRVTDREITLNVLSCEDGSLKHMVVTGRAFPKGKKDPFFESDTNMRLAINKLLEESLFLQALRAPASVASAGCKDD